MRGATAGKPQSFLTDVASHTHQSGSRATLVFATGTCLECIARGELEEEGAVKGLRFERIGNGQHYNVVFHIGSTYVPVSDETVEELKDQSLLPAERFLELLVDRVGYSSYLKDQIQDELKSSGDPVTQVTVLQGAIRDL
jgi:hypothetical protein